MDRSIYEMRKHMRVLKIVLGLVLFSALFPNSKVMAQEEESLYMVNAQDGAVMTASANVNGMVVAKLKQGTRVKLVREQGDWVKIDYNGRLGWVKGELISPFTKELLPIYSSYYKLLQSLDHIIYALVADFTQDGVEDLYVVLDSNPSKGQYEETIYSGDQVIYQNNNTNGLTIFKNANDYFLYHHTQTNSDKKFKLSQLNEQAKTDYYEVSGGKDTYEITANTYLKSYFVLSSGNGNVSAQTIKQEQIASKDFYGAEYKNEYEESIYLENYALSKNGKTESLLEHDFKELFSTYEKSKIVKVIYDDDYKSASLNERFTFDVARVQKELLDLAAAVLPRKQIEWDAIELEVLQQKLAQSVLLEMPYSEAISRNALSYFQMVEQGLQQGFVGYSSNDFGMNISEKETSFKRGQVDGLIYDFYGLKMNEEAFNRLGNNEGYLVDDENYSAPLIDAEPTETYTYRQLQAIESLENNYVALKYQDYEMPKNVIVAEANESVIIGGNELGKGYVLFKRLPFKTGVKWIYIDTVEQLEYLNKAQYATYENSLDIIQKFIAEQEKQNNDEEQSEEKLAMPIKSDLVTSDEQTNKGVFNFAIGIIFAAFIAGSYYVYRRKYS